MTAKPPFSADTLKLDCTKEKDTIIGVLRQSLKQFKKRGVIVALSGGIDSSVTASLCVRALGKNRVFGLLMPEKESSEETLKLSRLMAEHLGIPFVYKDITDILEAAGCYSSRNTAIKSIIPEYGPDFTSKIVLSNVLDADAQYRLFSVVVQSPEGEEKKVRLSLPAYLEMVAASNFKQRVRKMLEYYHADRLNYAVTGTPNRLEYDQGFFVKLGDGAADIKPIAHLYKTQVYQLAHFLGVPGQICNRPPTTDTYSMSQTQEEFFFPLPYNQMDLCLYAKNHGIPSIDVATVTGLTVEQVERVNQDIEAKRNATQYLHMPPILVHKVQEIST